VLLGVDQWEEEGTMKRLIDENIIELHFIHMKMIQYENDTINSKLFLRDVKGKG
jgi:hypothetical protein